jgi:hypothetical protein
MGATATGLTLHLTTALPGSPNSLLDERLASSPESESLDVAGHPAFLTRDETDSASSIYVYPDPMVELELTLKGAAKPDDQAILTALAEQAVSRLVAAGLATKPTPVALPSVDPTAGLCALVTLTEAADAVGKSLQAFVATPTACAFADDPNGAAPTAVILGLQRDTTGELEKNVRANLTDEQDADVGGIPALLSGPLPYQTVMRSDVYLFPDPNTVIAVAVAGPEDVDSQAAVRALGELVASRRDRLPSP